jgi:hypothetical protein
LPKLLLSQEKIARVETSPNKFKYKIELNESENSEDLKNKIVQNECEPGSPILGNKVIFIKIPAGKKINVKLADEEIKIFENYSPAINPEIKLSDSVFEYNQAEYSRKYFTDSFYPRDEVEVLDYFWLHDEYCCAIKINTFRYSLRTKKLYQIIKADLIVEYNDALVNTNIINGNSRSNDVVLNELILNNPYVGKQSIGLRKNTSNINNDWIDYGKEYVKLGIISDGIYRITFSDFIKYGLDPNLIDPSAIKLFLKGKELPISVQTKDISKFAEGDFIEFYAEKNYNNDDYRKQVERGDDYINYYDRYTDTTFVWLTIGTDKGLRTTVQKSNQYYSTDTIRTYLNKFHFEEDRKLNYYEGDQPKTQLPFWQENKVWTWYESWELGAKKSFNYFANEIVPDSKIKTYVRAISYAASAAQPVRVHNVGISINNDANIDTAFFNKNQTVTFKSEFNSNILQNGDNEIYIHNISTGISPNTFLLDWFDIEYRRNISAKYDNPKYQNDSLTFSVSDPIERGIKAIKISGITDQDLILYKIKPAIKKYSDFHFSNDLNYNMIFSDTLNTGDTFILLKEDLVKSPIFLYKKKFNDIKNNPTGSDYIIISNKVLNNSVNAYKEFIKENYKIRVNEFFVDDIYDNYSYGYKNPSAIKEFLFYAYTNWSAPKPKYLFFIGEANYDYKSKYLITPAEKIPDLVTSYGFPVSDSWYVCFDSLGINIPQLYVGRIPAVNNDEVIYYLQKHKSYLERQYDFLNKRVLLFSGGYVERSGEIEQLRKTNDEVTNIFNNSRIKPKVNHFYKTANPLSNFGPYNYEIVKNAIDSGAVYISYLGHSATQTWDNGINTTQQLENNFNGNPLMADFGCSTGKFAEPDIKSFGELFVNNIGGQAIAYIGNSSVGFLSIATTFPQIFAKYLVDTLSLSIGELHFLGKMKLFQQNGGFNDVNRAFNYCSILIGDPIVHLKFPPKPNLYLLSQSVSVLENQPNDKNDFLTLRFTLLNDGRTSEDTITINVTDNYKNSVIFNKKINLKCPDYSKTIEIKIPVKNLPGQHQITIFADSSNLLDEINEDDNEFTLLQNVSSASIKTVAADNLYGTINNLIVLNPVSESSSNNKIIFAVDTLSSLENAKEFLIIPDTLFTSYKPANLLQNKRYWWRVKLNDPGSDWSSVNSFYNSDKNFSWFISNPLSELKSENINFNPSEEKWELIEKQNRLRIISAGLYDGATTIVEYNGEDKIGENLWGLATALIDSVTLKPYNVLLFRSGGASMVDSLASYINHLPTGTMIAMTIGIEARNYILGSDMNSPSRQAIKTLGSQFIDQVGYRESWALLGKKGATTGSVPEVHKKVLEGQAVIDTIFYSKADSGYVEFPVVKNVKSWESIEINKEGNINSFLICENNAGVKDTIGSVNNSDVFELNGLNEKNINQLKVVSKFKKSSDGAIPSLKYVGMKFKSLPELATNYQVVSISNDSLMQGENEKLAFKVYNVGESTADSFNVKVEIVNQDNSREKIFEEIVDSLGSGKRKEFTVNYNTAYITGKKNFYISIDPENKINELYEDNNFYSVQFYVKPNNAPANLRLTIDGGDIIDGDFISANPLIKIELDDQSPIPISDTNHVKIFLNNLKIPFNNPEINYSFSTNNPKFVVDYTPKLADGNYTLKIFGTNATGTMIDSSGITKKFSVNSTSKLLDVYNYPNPFAGDTYFTFKLTQIPDEIRIKIFTIAGRMVKEIKLLSSELNYDFNRVYWDGRDEEGDLLANGVYLYKIIMKKGSETINATQKLAIIR